MELVPWDSLSMPWLYSISITSSHVDDLSPTEEEGGACEGEEAAREGKGVVGGGGGEKAKEGTEAEAEGEEGAFLFAEGGADDCMPSCTTSFRSPLSPC